MLADAIRSESYRLVRNRTTVFWGVVFVPLALAIGGAIFNWITKIQSAKMMADAKMPALPAGLGQEPVNLAEAMVPAAALGANGIVLVFSLIVAAALYAGDYRWETWRLISARNTRLNLILGKVATMGLVVLIGLILFQVGMALFGLSQAVITGRPLAFQIDAAALGDAGQLALLAWLRVLQYTMLALLTAVVTRSLLAALFVPFVVGFGQSLLGSIGLPLLGWSASDWQAVLLMPGAAFDTLKMAVSPDGNPFMVGPRDAVPTAALVIPQEALIRAATSLALWTLAPFAAALAWFQRQDLSKE